MSGETDAGEVTTTIKASTTVTLPAHPHKPSYEELNPRSTATEFLGPWGTGAISVLAPFWAYFIFYACNETTGCHPRSSWAWRQSFAGLLGEWPTTTGQLWRWDAVAVYLGWYAFCVVCAAVLPGPKVEGTLMRNGKRKTYKMNGELPVALVSKQSAGRDDRKWVVKHGAGWAERQGRADDNVLNGTPDKQRASVPC
jgi:delta14-sterol reductase